VVVSAASRIGGRTARVAREGRAWSDGSTDGSGALVTDPRAPKAEIAMRSTIALSTTTSPMLVARATALMRLTLVSRDEPPLLGLRLDTVFPFGNTMIQQTELMRLSVRTATKVARWTWLPR
jgi:hypothetical protein